MENTRYDGVIILGRGWRGYPCKRRLVNGKLEIFSLSKINCKVAAEMYASGATRKIIIGAGKSAGKKWPAESKAMKDYLLKKYPTFPESDILTQEEGLDTYEEVQLDLEIAGKNNLERLALITIDTQLPRCEKFLRSLGKNIDCISSEETAKIIFPYCKRFLKKYHDSSVFKYERTKEFILRGMQNIGITGWFTKYLAKIIRSYLKS